MLVTFRGGPLDGAELPAEFVPWPLFVPRIQPDSRPRRTLTLEEVVGQAHYAIVGISHGCKLYEWRPASPCARTDPRKC